MTLREYFADERARDWDAGGVDAPVRMGVVGLGEFARELALPAMAAGDYCAPSVLVSGDGEKARRIADEFGVERTLTYDEYHAGYAAGAYDAVYVATPNALHLDVAETAAGMGKHVVVEKPLEADAERARELVDACDEAGVTLMTAYRMQVDPTMRGVRDLIRDGVVGDPVQVHGDFSFDLLAAGDADQWRLDADLAGGGALMDVGVYPLNTARFLLDADPVSVQAAVSSPDAGFEEVDEHVAFQLEFPDDVTASCTASYGAFAENRLRVVGTEGAVEVDPAFDADLPRTVTVRREGTELAVTEAGANELGEQFDYFAHCVRTGETPEPDGRDGLVDVEVMSAVLAAAESGERTDA